VSQSDLLPMMTPTSGRFSDTRLFNTKGTEDTKEKPLWFSPLCWAGASSDRIAG